MNIIMAGYADGSGDSLIISISSLSIS